MTPRAHLPVLLDESIGGLRVVPGGVYVDGTFGGGGHTASILRASAPNGRVIAFDLDAEAIARGDHLRASLEQPDRLTMFHSNFATMRAKCAGLGIEAVDGVLLDLGLSTFQLEEAERGFSFQHEGPIDMRFDQQVGVPAINLVERTSDRELAEILWTFGEERRSRRIAAAIHRASSTGRLSTTLDLAEVVTDAVGGRRNAKTHPATRTFQALRIAVNDELDSLSNALDEAIELTRSGGRIVIISFHSLEDRIVKQLLRREATSCVCPEEQPICTCRHQPRVRLAGRAQRASQSELSRNSRSRSAILRVAERL